MRTLSVSEIEEGGPPDLDGLVVDGIDALAQRLRQAVLLRVGGWFLNRPAGIPEDVLIGNATTADLAASAITEAVRREGGGEVTGIASVEYSIDQRTRTFGYRVVVNTIYGEMIIDGGPA